AKFPENFFLLRGNHECASITRIYGFYDECKRRYNIKLWKLFCDVFNCMPVCAIVDEKIMCMHGGLSPEISDFKQIRNLVRPTDVPDTGLICDLLWADPDKDIAGWAENDRGVSFIFGPDVVTGFLQKHDLDLVCRAHQVVEDGYEFFAKRQLITLFSAPNYCGEFDNAGAMMTIDETLMCSFKVLKPVKGKKSEGRKSWQDAGAVGRPHYSALAVALIRYLQVNFPLDLEMLVQVHCCFGLEAELAVLLEGKAGRLAQRLGRKWEKICSEEGEEQLLMCLSLYLECAKLFLKGKRYQRQLVANELAALVCLQLKAVQINLAVSLNEQQNAAISLRQEIGDWKEVSSDGPEALAAAMVDASGLGPLPKAEVSGGSLESAESDNGDADALAEVEGQDSETKLAGAEVLSSSSESPTAPPSPGGASAVADSLVPTLNLGPAGDIFVVVNLEEAEVEVFAEYHQDFIAAFEV
ncbi:unnamed protein product, partial [Polarella glacialis]